MVLLFFRIHSMYNLFIFIYIRIGCMILSKRVEAYSLLFWESEGVCEVQWWGLGYSEFSQRLLSCVSRGWIENHCWKLRQTYVFICRSVTNWASEASRYKECMIQQDWVLFMTVTLKTKLKPCLLSHIVSVKDVLAVRSELVVFHFKYNYKWLTVNELRDIFAEKTCVD